MLLALLTLTSRRTSDAIGYAASATGSLYRSPLAIIAQAIRAILLAALLSRARRRHHAYHSFDHFVGVCQPTWVVMFGYPSYKTISSYLLDGATDKSMSFAPLETVPYFELNFCHDSTNFRASA